MIERCSFLFLLFLLFVSLNAASIEKGWEDVFGDSHSTTLPIQVAGNKSYLMVTSYKLNFLQAMDFCENMHMNLVTIESAEEQEIVQKFVINANSGNEFWTAASKVLDAKTWLWLTTGNVIEFTAWSPGEPNGGNNELCVGLFKTQNKVMWNDFSCDREFAFICERPLDEKREDVFAEEEKNWENILNVHEETPNLDLLHFQGKDYYISQDYKGNYLEALDYCRALNMQLVSINSKEENDILYRRIRDISAGTDFWSSGTRLLDGKNWLWLPSAASIGYTNWAPNEPNNINDRCLHLTLNKPTGLFWNDNNCNNAFKVICETSSGEQGGINENDDEEFMSKLNEMTPGNIQTVSQDGKTFYLSRNLLATASQARKFCSYHNMKLVDVQNAEENIIIAKVLPYPVVNGPFWIDGKKEDGKWVWKSAESTITYFNWHIDSPKSEQNLCLGLTTFGQYDDESCNKKKPFICELESDKNTGKDNRDAIVTVFMTNNLITKNGKTTQAKELVSSQYVETGLGGGYHITVDNNAAKC